MRRRADATPAHFSTNRGVPLGNIRRGTRSRRSRFLPRLFCFHVFGMILFFGLDRVKSISLWFYHHGLTSSMVGPFNLRNDGWLLVAWHLAATVVVFAVFTILLRIVADYLIFMTLRTFEGRLGRITAHFQLRRGGLALVLTTAAFWLSIKLGGFAFLLGAMIFAGHELLSCVWFVTVDVRHRSRVMFKRCPRCGYSLLGGTGPVCPECGSDAQVAEKYRGSTLRLNESQ